MLYSGRDAVNHPKQGMSEAHMAAFATVARKRQELIMVRPVSPWAKQMISDGYPTKGFAVKAKSSNQKPLVADYDLLVSPYWRDWDPRKDNPFIPVAIKNAFNTAKKLHQTEVERSKPTTGLGRKVYWEDSAGEWVKRTRDTAPEIERPQIRHNPSTAPRAAGMEVGSYEESHEYGNRSNRVRDCVDELNKQMGYTDKRACLRTVHHNAVLISPFPQDIKDDLPATIFLPTSVDDINVHMWVIDAPENLKWFLKVASEDFYLPRNSAHKGNGGIDNDWGISGFKDNQALKDRFSLSGPQSNGNNDLAIASGKAAEAKKQLETSLQDAAEKK